MRVLCIGDAHGKEYPKLERVLKKYDIDVILCTGDLSNTDLMRKYIFKYWDTPLPLQDILGVKRWNSILKKTLISSKVVITQLAKTHKPILVVGGNSDYLDSDVEDKKTKRFTVENQIKDKKMISFLKADIKRIDKIEFVGITGYGIKKNKTKHKKAGTQMGGYFRDHLRLSLKKIHKDSIVLSHDAPYGFFDKVKNKESPMFGKHVGDREIRHMIIKRQPKFYVFGHMHEYFGKKKIGKTTILACGVGNNGKYWVIDTDKDKLTKIDVFIDIK